MLPCFFALSACRVDAESPFHIATLQSLLQLLGVLAVEEEAHHQKQQMNPPSVPQPQQDTPHPLQNGRPRSNCRNPGVQDQQQPQPQDEQQLPQPQHQQPYNSLTPQELLLRLQAFCQGDTDSSVAVIGHSSSSSSSCEEAAPGAQSRSGGEGSMANSREGTESSAPSCSGQAFAQMSVQQITSLTAKQIRIHDGQLLALGTGSNPEPGHLVQSSSSAPELHAEALASVQHMKWSFRALADKHMAEVAR